MYATPYPTILPSRSPVEIKKFTSTIDQFKEGPGPYLVSVVPVMCCFFSILLFLIYRYRKSLIDKYGKEDEHDHHDKEYEKEQVLELIRGGIKAHRKHNLKLAENCFVEALRLLQVFNDEEAEQGGHDTLLNPVELVTLYYEYASLLLELSRQLEALPLLQKAHRIMKRRNFDTDYNYRDLERADRTLVKCLHRHLGGDVTQRPHSYTDDKASSVNGGRDYSRFNVFMKPNPLHGSKDKNSSIKGPDSVSNVSSDDRMSQSSDPSIDEEMKDADTDAFAYFSDSDLDNDDDNDSIDTLGLRELIRIKRLQINAEDDRQGEGDDHVHDDIDLPTGPPPPDDVSQFLDDYIRSHATVL